MSRIFRCFCILVALAAITGTLQAQVTPERPSSVAQKSFRHPGLTGQDVFQEVGELPSKAALDAHRRLIELGVEPSTARLDARSGRFATLLPAEPMIPGDGVGNTLQWSDLGKAAAPQDRDHGQAAWQAVRAYLVAHQAELGVDVGELAETPTITSHDGGDLVQIHAQRFFDDIPVRGSYVNAVVSHGNLILLGAHKWADRGASSNRPQLTEQEAKDAAVAYLAPLDVTGYWGKSDRAFLALYNGNAQGQGQGYRYELVWSVRPSLRDSRGSWEVLVDVFTGDVVSLEDLNEYAEVQGGVLPVSNDGVAPDGVEQAGWPMPYATTSLGTTDTGGNVAGSGSFSADLAGTYVNINDNCGSSSLSGSDTVDYGTSGGTDCTTPAGGPAGNTHASRTGFYELNKIIEMARGQLPSNSWLQGTLTSNMNINSTCNAYWNGTVNFYRSGGGCANTGELAGVFDHEWGHGMDANDATPGIASPSGEGIADIYTALRLNNSCIGRNFRPGVQCGGYGDPCTNCTGVRDIDYLKHQSGNPHTFTWRNANCGSTVHCIGYVYSEAVWSLWKRKLQAAPYNYDNNTAHEITNRLTYIGAGATGTWYSGSPPNGGCAGSSGYMNYLAADDDNGNLNDGTPHMQAIYDAFNDQEIACSTPTVQDSGCSGVPTSAPSVSGSAGDKSADLSWNTVAGATSYAVYRAEGVFACDFGKVKLGETTGTTWNDTGLQNGRTYSYVVIPKSGAACFGPASSCTNVTPASGPNLTIDTGSASTSITGGDSDAYLDNCETGTMTFTVNNTGAGTLTNVRITSIVPSNPGVTVTTSLPAAISPSSIGQGGSGTGSFSFTAGGLSFGETLTFTVTVDANELPSAKSAGLDEPQCETDLSLVPAQTFTFETGAEGWTTIQGTFARSSAGGGANGTTWYEQSSANLDNQCDQIQSPVMVFTATTTLTLSNNYDIEPIYTNGEWYDRANVGLVVGGGSRSLVSPDGGRLYNATGVNGTCGTTGQDGWADAATTWAASTFSASALGSAGLAGQEVQIDVRYGTDASLNGYGFRFDEVTVTDVQALGPDAQSDTCGCEVDADCDNGLWCDGAETCVGGVCQAGTPPNCNDGVACTDDSCNEGTDSCDNVANDANCDNGLWCDGAETCNATLGCQAGTAPNCNDGVSCTDDSCNEGTDQCDNVANDANCDDGLFCNGAETCNATLDCQAGSDPCAPYGCDETGDVCLECNVDADCDDGLFCNGAETCNAGSCQAGSDPCPGQGCDETGDVCTSQNGPQDAVYDAGLGAPKCDLAGSECDSTTLLDSRDTLSPPEPNQPNTLDTCTDGTSGTYHNDESNDRIVVKTLDGADMVEGATVQVDATVYAWSTGTSDHLDLWYAADANSPSWQLITTINLATGGLQTLSAQYTLPAGALQAVRANFRYNGSQSTCSTGSYDDTDDLVFAVKPANPCTVDADCDDGLFCNGAETCNAGVCQAGSDPCPGQGCDEIGDVCTAGGCVIDDDFEAGAPDWRHETFSTCTTGIYVTGNPTNPSGGYQISGSHSGVTSIFSATNITSGVDDIDGGNCILGSPSYPVAANSTLRVWYWFGQRDAGDDAAGDFHRLEYSTDDGVTWTTLASNGDSTVNPVWTEATASIPAGSTVQLRMQCSDGPATGDLVECGIDDFSICN